jgi:Putative DNA-binding domain
VIERKNWLEADLLSLIATAEKESLSLDYKACDALGQSDGKKNEISKDVSAFANSAGGIIIYGVLEDGFVPTKIDNGFDRTELSKEWLEQIITSRIQRQIDGIVVHEVDLPVSSPGRVAYVVSIPQSMRAPHQASDKRFYKRHNFKSAPMEEYEIRDVSRRLDRPDLNISYQSAPAGTEVVGDGKAHTQLFDLSPVVVNHSATQAEYGVFNFFIDQRISPSAVSSSARASGETSLQVAQISYLCSLWTVNHGIPGNLPIFKGPTFKLLERPFRVRVPHPGRYALGSQIYAPGMEPRLDRGFLLWDGQHITITKDQS